MLLSPYGAQLSVADRPCPPPPQSTETHNQSNALRMCDTQSHTSKLRKWNDERANPDGRPRISEATRHLRLPHPEFEQLIGAIEKNVTGERICEFDGTETRYFVYDPWPSEADLAKYDEDANFYLPESFVNRHPGRAQLVAINEHVETIHKLASRSHAYAHRRAILLKLLDAKVTFGTRGRLRAYLQWRIGAYPDLEGAGQAGIRWTSPPPSPRTQAAKGPDPRGREESEAVARPRVPPSPLGRASSWARPRHQFESVEIADRHLLFAVRSS